MSNTLCLIVRPRGERTRHDVLRQVLSGISGTLSPPLTDDEDEYALTVDGPTIWVDLAAGYDDDGVPDPVPLGAFPWHFSVEKPSVDRWLDVALRNLRRIFDQLVASGDYDALLAEIEYEYILASNVSAYPATEPDVPAADR